MPRERRTVTAPRWSPALLALLLAVAVGATALYGIAFASDDAQWTRTANGVLPAVLGAVCLWTAYRTLRKHPQALWTPLPWFLAAWAAYYGFGPLAYVYGTPRNGCLYGCALPGRRA
ncbi:MAG: hypothetical protein KatS3mg082_2637 [Nitrospiraceae bacterium]|nr:MAG: hypothetical protein KatS3mg082_2637 [Nitrospiraceae bacterium]